MTDPLTARLTLNLSQTTIASILAISRRQWQYYESGRKVAPPILSLALAFLMTEAGLSWVRQKLPPEKSPPR